MAATKTTRPEFRMRRLRVAAGDAFGGASAGALLVLHADGFRARCWNEASKRTTSIQVRRLQRGYHRCGESETAAVHRAWGRWKREQQQTSGKAARR